MTFSEYMNRYFKTCDDAEYQYVKDANFKLRDYLIPSGDFYQHALSYELGSAIQMDDATSTKLIKKFMPESMFDTNGKIIPIDELYTTDYAKTSDPVTADLKPITEMSEHEKAMLTDQILDRIKPYMNNAFSKAEIERIDADDNVSVILHEICGMSQQINISKVTSSYCTIFSSTLANLLHTYSAHDMLQFYFILKHMLIELFMNNMECIITYQLEQTDGQQSDCEIMNECYSVDLDTALSIADYFNRSIKYKLKVIYLP